jgi:hypothetical protein
MAQNQTLSGTRWDITIKSISSKPFDFIFGTTGNKGNVLYPDSTLADFTWTEDEKGNWLITVVRIINGVQKTESFYGRITGNTGTGFYANTANRKKLKPLTMVKNNLKIENN